MESIYSQLLAHCLQGTRWPASLIGEVREGLGSNEGSKQFFRIVIERLGDLFEPHLCDVYARLMSEILADPSLERRFHRIRLPRLFDGADPRSVYVLSRITLGADVAVTSVVLDAAKKRFPKARIVFVGPRKNWELFAADPRIEHQDSPYGRTASFADRIAARPWFDEPDALVLDPDSRLSQLGLLPVTPNEDRYFLFESRGYAAESGNALPELASQWCQQTLGTAGAAYVAPKPASIAPATVTVNLGVGENVEKRIAEPFEAELLGALPQDTLIDLGGSPEEAARVQRAAGSSKRMFQGSFADFAWLVSQSKQYVGYDSAGMHVAAACRIPMLCIFAGDVSERFFQRWRPTGSGDIRIVRNGPDVLARAQAELETL